MTILPVQNMTNINGYPINSQDVLFYWGPFQAGDEGAPVTVYAFPFYAWQFTGYPRGGSDINNLVPIEPSRTIILSGSNDGICYGDIDTMHITDAAGMMNRIHDPLRCNQTDGRYIFVKPKAGGAYNPAGGDCGLLLFCPRMMPLRII